MSLFPARSANCCSVSLLALALLLPGNAAAQSAGASAPQVSVPVVQAVPRKSAGLRLNDALAQLARSPLDIDALGEAGQASLELGDAQAAIGFYRRALTIQPGNARIKAGLAGAYVLSEDPFTAIDLFDEAEKAGTIDPARLSDRGLAFDLVGDSKTAQLYYQQSLAVQPSDETLRRLGLSQAISRDRRAMDLTLAPLLQKQDKAAWRTRAFGLAVIGQIEEAEAIAKQTMPADLAGAITAYLRYMPRLTPAQQAAAGNLGRFPRAAEMGVDDPRVARYSRSRVQLAVATPAVPASPAKGKRDDKGGKGRKGNAQTPALAAVPPPEPEVLRETSAPATRLSQTVPPVTATAKPAPQVTRPAASTPQVAIVQSTAPASPPIQPSVVPAGSTTLNTAAAKPVSFDLAKTPPAPVTTPPASTTPTPAAPTPASAPTFKPVSIDEAFADLAPPSSTIEPQDGAVDVRQIRPAMVATASKGQDEPAGKLTGTAAPSSKGAPVKGPGAKGTPDAASPGKGPAGKGPAGKDRAGKDQDKSKDSKTKAPAKPSHPSRIWVQLAAGRDKAALGFDWRKFGKEDPAVFKGKAPYVSAWGQTNRLLAGPFASAREANAFLAQLKKAGFNGAFVWTSPAGQVVDALNAGK